MCPFLHFHSILRGIPPVIVDGSQPYASAAISGNFVCRSLKPFNTFFPAQNGHPLPSFFVRSLTLQG